MWILAGQPTLVCQCKISLICSGLIYRQLSTWHSPFLDKLLGNRYLALLQLFCRVLLPGFFQNSTQHAYVVPYKRFFPRVKSKFKSCNSKVRVLLEYYTTKNRYYYLINSPVMKRNMKLFILEKKNHFIHIYIYIYM